MCHMRRGFHPMADRISGRLGGVVRGAGDCRAGSTQRAPDVMDRLPCTVQDLPADTPLAAAEALSIEVLPRRLPEAAAVGHPGVRIRGEGCAAGRRISLMTRRAAIHQEPGNAYSRYGGGDGILTDGINQCISRSNHDVSCLSGDTLDSPEGGLANGFFCIRDRRMDILLERFLRIGQAAPGQFIRFVELLLERPL